MDMFNQPAEASPGNAMANPSKKPKQPQTTLWNKE